MAIEYNYNVMPDDLRLDIEAWVMRWRLRPDRTTILKLVQQHLHGDDMRHARGIVRFTVEQGASEHYERVVDIFHCNSGPINEEATNWLRLYEREKGLKLRGHSWDGGVIRHPSIPVRRIRCPSTRGFNPPRSTIRGGFFMRRLRSAALDAERLHIIA